MAQIYLLAVMVTLTASLTLSSEFLAGKISSLQPLFDIFSQKKARWGLGSIAAIVGILKMVFRSPGEGVRVAGDLIVALTGIGIGALLLLSALYHWKEGEERSRLGRIIDKALGARAFFGLAGMLVSILHFLFPGALLI